MIIQTDERYLKWRDVNYLIDHENELAFIPSQVRDAGLCYQRLVRRGKMISHYQTDPRLPTDLPNKKPGKLKKIWNFLKYAYTSNRGVYPPDFY